MVAEADRIAPHMRIGGLSVAGVIVAIPRQPKGGDLLSWTMFAPAGKVLFDFKNRVVVLQSGIAISLAKALYA